MAPKMKTQKKVCLNYHHNSEYMFGISNFALISELQPTAHCYRGEKLTARARPGGSLLVYINLSNISMGRQAWS